jgi:glycosyltransferase involved in cell wall biosynthesis
MNNGGVSVVVCTFNGAERLVETLRHLSLQKVPLGIPWEVLVVNNASTDNTLKVVNEEFFKYRQLQLEFTVIQQPLPGKINAVKIGFTEAKYSTIILCDDDNWLSPDYVRLAAELMDSDHQIAVVGGIGTYYPQEPRSKEIEGLDRYYVNGPQDWTEKEHWVYGAGAVYRKIIFLKLFQSEWQFITFGRVGNKLNGGEDAEFCFAAYLLGYKIIYDGRLQFQHFVPIERQTQGYVIRLNFWLSYSNVLLNSYFALIYGSKISIKETVNKWCLSSLKTLLKSSATFYVQKILKPNESNIEQHIHLQSSLGTFAALVKNRKRIMAHHHHLVKLMNLPEHRQEHLSGRND